MNTGYGVRSSRPGGLFSFGLLDGLHVRLRRPYLREAPAGFGLERLATAFMNNPGLQLVACHVSAPPEHAIYFMTFGKRDCRFHKTCLD